MLDTFFGLYEMLFLLLMTVLGGAVAVSTGNFYYAGVGFIIYGLMVFTKQESVD